MSDQERTTPPDRQDESEAGDAKPLGQDVPHRNYSEDEEAALEQRQANEGDEEQNIVISPDE